MSSKFRKIARKRIDYLLGRARLSLDYANRFSSHALRLFLRHKVPFSKSDKLKVCKKCGGFMGKGGSRVRITNNKLVVTCLNCGFKRRIPLKNK